MVTVTKKALREIKHIMIDQNIDSTKSFFRVRVVGGGCSGFQTKLDLDEKYNETTDIIEEIGDGIKMVIDKRSMLYVTGATVDFHESIDKRGFVIDNSLAVSKCGCGSSFSM